MAFPGPVRLGKRCSRLPLSLLERVTVTHVISTTYSRFDRMSPTAAVLAVLLHVVTALAIWWVSPLNRPDPEEDAIDVTIEPPKVPPAVAEPKPLPPPAATARPVPPPPSPPAAPRPPAPKAQVPFGLTPPSPTTAEKTEPAAPKGEPVQTPPTEPSKPDTKAQDKPPAPEPQQPPQQALAPQEPAPPPPTLERELPPIETPPAPLTSKDFPKPVPPPPPPPVKPQARPAPQPGPQPQLRPSPLSQLPQRRVPSGNARGDQTSTTFVNPAVQASKTRAVEQYLWQVTQKIAQYQPYLKERNVQGTVIVRLVIARDGRLLGASIAQSSGIIDLDRALMETVHAAAPFPPLPAEIADAQVAFRVPLGFRPR